MKKLRFPQEALYLIALVTMAIGVALTDKAGFGFSMVVAPAYIFSEWLGISFGTAEYLFQGALLIVMSLILRRFRLYFLFSFITAFLYGLILDGCIVLFAFLPNETILLRILWFSLGLLITAPAVAMFYRVYISPEVYELFVKELSAAFRIRTERFKIGYDIGSALLSLVLSFAVFGFGVFRGIGWGTLVTVLCNGLLIGASLRFVDRYFDFYPALPIEKYFQNSPPSVKRED